MMLWADLYKSKKMRAVSLWNDLPWFYNVSQVGKVYTSITILKFFDLPILSKYSETVEKVILESGVFWVKSLCGDPF